MHKSYLKVFTQTQNYTLKKQTLLALKARHGMAVLKWQELEKAEVGLVTLVGIEAY
jgi:hypothetical protein